MASLRWGRWLDVVIDAVSHAFTTIGYAHHEVHEGNHYFVRDYTTIGATSYALSITTPDSTTWMHDLIKYASTKDCVVEVYKDATVTGGTAITPENSNQNSSNTSVMVFKKGVTISVAGTRIYGYQLGTGTNPAVARDGTGTRGSELILKQNSTYVIKFTSTAADNIISWDFSYYEHVSKEAQ